MEKQVDQKGKKILIVSEIALFLGGIGGPLAFQGLMNIIPSEIKQVYTILSPIHGFIVYTLIILIVRPLSTLKTFNILYALPISLFFSVGNFINAEIGKEVPGFLIHLTNQLTPVVIILLQVIFRLKPIKSFSILEWIACLLLIVGESIYVQHFQINYYILLCLLKPLPLSVAFIYIEYLLKKKYQNIFPTYLWWSVCLWQMFFSLGISNLDFKSIKEGIQCSWFGVSVKYECENMPFWTLFGAFLSSCQNIPMPFISKYGGGHQVLILRAISFPFVVLGQIMLFNKQGIDDFSSYFSCLCASVSLFLIAYNKTVQEKRGEKVKEE